MKGFLAALRFLTVFPFPGKWGTQGSDLGRSVGWFPWVGLALGAVAAAAAWGLSHVAPPLVIAALLCLVLAGFSGAMHLDGLADAADGLLSGRAGHEVLAIMKDSRVGAMGVVAVVSVLLVKFAALGSLGAERVWPTVWLMPLAGRCAMVLQLAWLPYLRPEGLGAVFGGRRLLWPAVEAIVLLPVAGWMLLGPAGAVIAVVAVAATGLLAICYHRRLGGATGDMYGATCEVIEATLALSAAICFAQA
ncbi:MAG TPA: adenosylcobinamide-GDP ribazoletransferase [Planctomycetes bacterium]|nr:adenosylcobinamide-GDP ribazoletransferase [Planctomycetota bacterium]